MILSWVEAHHFRNLVTARIPLGHNFNIFLGGNGAGKTSLLEAIYVLGRGSSFRSAHNSSLITQGFDSFAVSGQLVPDAIVVGIEHQRRDGNRYRINGGPVLNRASLIERLPVQFIGPDSHQLITEGPQLRRRFLDWGVFHVEPSFISIWQRYQRVLKQRNAALRQGHILKVWDAALVEAAHPLDNLRRTYLNQFHSIALHYIAKLCNLKVGLEYLGGWRQGTSFEQVLLENREQDQALGHTRFGPHRADVQIKVNGKAAKDVVSRGQQKLLVTALLIAQTAFTQKEQRPCLILIDDLASELDMEHRQAMLSLLAELKSQIIITAVEEWPWLRQQNQTRVFHVEQGSVTPQN